MRLFCELFLVAVLVWLGWTKSFHDRIDQMRGVQPPPLATAHQTQVRQAIAATDNSVSTITPAPRQPFLPASARTRPPSTTSGDWMWDPAHRNTLDKPAYKTGSTSAQQTPSQGYWIDSRGVRHYTNGAPPPGASP
ncbi:MAG: hypothetical protein DME45_03415 [Verrucomicrobia bacterium]|nr:MAG: hypothetical protein DME45_03415 [Verrucomicrobiota bacterium]PYK74991.1 MAG: hypothetical protein DME42_03535 [Verrucomicrobiota bacterium]